MGNLSIEQKPVVVSLSDIRNGITCKYHSAGLNSRLLKKGSVVFESLEAAFGPSSLGILIVKELPSKFLGLRARLLCYASYLANLSPDILDRLTVPEAKYLVGWSHGKEALKSSSYDTLKGSYYVNCAFYKDPSLQNAPAEGFPSFSEYTHPNIWPSESILPGFRETFEELCTLIIDIAVLVARACDRYAAAHIDDYPSGYLEHVVTSSLTTKARLLHYFPSKLPPTTGFSSNETPDEEEDSWCATHLDHGCLTGLTSALFVNENFPGSFTPFTMPFPSPPALPPFPTFHSPPDPSAGLYIHSRTGNTIKVNIPEDCLAFQTGEALEVITKGKFRAVPHFVKAPKPSLDGDKVARNTLAVFTQPNLGEIIDREKGIMFGDFARGVVDRHTWRDG